MSLEELRKKIDEADIRIVKLIADRIRIAEEIGREKKRLGKQIEDTAREKEVFNPMCHFITGFFVGVFEELSGKKLECSETICPSKTGPYCEFQLTSYE